MRSAWLFLMAFATAVASQQSAEPGVAQFEIAHADSLIDEPIAMRVAGLAPGENVTIRVRGGVNDAWTANASFIADGDGRISSSEFVADRCQVSHGDPRCTYGANLEFLARDRNRNGNLDRTEMDGTRPVRAACWAPSLSAMLCS